MLLLQACLKRLCLVSVRPLGKRARKLANSPRALRFEIEGDSQNGCRIDEPDRDNLRLFVGLLYLLLHPSERADDFLQAVRIVRDDAEGNIWIFG